MTETETVKGRVRKEVIEACQIDDGATPSKKFKNSDTYTAEDLKKSREEARRARQQTKQYRR